MVERNQEERVLKLLVTLVTLFLMAAWSRSAHAEDTLQLGSGPHLTRALGAAAIHTAGYQGLKALGVHKFWAYVGATALTAGASLAIDKGEAWNSPNRQAVGVGVFGSTVLNVTLPLVIKNW